MASERSTSLAENSKQLPNLPLDVIFQILCRLPVKSLLQFRCVCKSWCSLIFDSRFVKTHLTCMTTEDDDYKHHRIIFIKKLGLESCSIYSVLHEPSVPPFDLDYPLRLKNPGPKVSIVGSSNGLLCIEIDSKDLFIWNPSIRKSKRLPRLLGSDMRRGHCFMACGFVYDESIVDYKVVAVFPFFGNGDSHETQVNVYTLRTDTWRRIQNFPCGEPFDSGKFANKDLHWPVRVITESNYSWAIVSLDLAEETYKEVAQPKYGDGVCRDNFFDPLYKDGDFNLKLGILRGCLCVLCNYHGSHADVWVMKEYGVKDSWTKLISIPYLTVFRCSQYSVPLCISNNGEILLKFGSSTVIYDLKESALRLSSIHNFPSMLEVNTYVESLVSPSADNELQEYH